MDRLHRERAIVVRCKHMCSSPKQLLAEKTLRDNESHRGDSSEEFIRVES